MSTAPDSQKSDKDHRQAPKAGTTPPTLWTMMIKPAAAGSEEHLGMLFGAYKPSVCALIKQYRLSLPQEEIEDLYHEFVRVCLHRDFLANVDRSKGRFRHFLWTCVRRFLQDDHERRQRRPEAHVDGIVANGVGEEPGIEIPRPDGAEWMALDEAWALQVEAMVLKAVDIGMKDAGRPEAARNLILKRLKGAVTGTLKDQAHAVGMDETTYNNWFYPARNAYRRYVRLELSRQVDAIDLDEELDHLETVLGRIRKRDAA
jgi:DNA-directed RNA polymerase specialized sigma24 family protein